MNQPNKKIAIYPGSFDPITNGHLDIIQRGLRLFDEIIVVVAINSLKLKNPVFNIDERVQMIKEIFKDEPKITAINLTVKLIIEYATEIGAVALLRGIRAVSDFEFEFAMAAMNRSLNDTVETVFLTPIDKYGFVSSSLTKEVAMVGGDVSKFVPILVKQALAKKFKKKSS